MQFVRMTSDWRFVTSPRDRSYAKYLGETPSKRPLSLADLAFGHSRQLAQFVVAHVLALLVEVEPDETHALLRRVATCHPREFPTISDTRARTRSRSEVGPFSGRSDSPPTRGRNAREACRSESAGVSCPLCHVTMKRTSSMWMRGVYFIVGVCVHASGMLPRICTCEKSCRDAVFTICSVSTKLAT